MRSMKLLVATALVAALVAGPVLAADSDTMTPATTMKAPVKKHTVKKHHTVKKTTTAPAPVAQ